MSFEVAETPQAESQFLALTSGIQTAHESLAEDFLRRVQAFLRSNPKIQNYGISSYSWEESETLNLKVSDKISLNITMKVGI